MRTGKWAVPLLILTCAIASTGSTQERRLKHSDLPPAVQKTADQESHGATLVAYEAHVRTGTKRSEIQVGPDGKPLAHPE